MLLRQVNRAWPEGRRGEKGRSSVTEASELLLVFCAFGNGLGWFFAPLGAGKVKTLTGRAAGGPDFHFTAAES